VRVLEVPIAHGREPVRLQARRGGMLVQSTDAKLLERNEARVVTKKAPSESQWADLLFAWRVAKFVKSNAIVFCRDRATVGVAQAR
jgi:phosphoribosylaminoimidazolecarboxamide formyltransferase/IMP cyclohydrolase